MGGITKARKVTERATHLSVYLMAVFLWHENSYPLAAFGAWRQAYQQRWRQIPLVEEEPAGYAVGPGVA